ncbi:pimeloyl-ACP methyl ester carboxylesterase [Actinokineospora baliensis]|uniref:alpha/beta fold hydrolase n=1 Tax=Actinokineospora baliensis TaxID=547056 RepID=UPI00195A18F1|nr:alpha/beta hydrolase [Actinokineospora baliensis]MBM7774570.1 pimeloyl-ACP methyl ester carboxylesterase [Actinokineospora baliensis]
MSESTREAKLDVPGATLHYEVAGSGPVLLLITGAPADATSFAGMVPVLARNYTVVTFDPRGYTRSSLQGEPVEQHLEDHADDAHRLLAEVTDEPAYVLGTSGGALVGIELAIRHPEQVKVLVAHEPAAIDVLPDGEQWREYFDEVVDTFHKEGAFPAVGKFIKIVGVNPEDMPAQPEPTPEMLAGMEQMRKNFELFFPYQLQQFTKGTPDIAALKEASPRVVWAGGTGSRGLPCYVATEKLAELYGEDLVEFPGDHQGLMTHPQEFSEALETALRD